MYGNLILKFFILKVIIKYFKDQLAITDKDSEKVAEEYLLKVCPLALYVDENNQNLKKIMSMKINSQMSYRKKKSYCNIKALEKLVKKEI